MVPSGPYYICFIWLRAACSVSFFSSISIRSTAEFNWYYLKCERKLCENSWNFNKLLSQFTGKLKYELIWYVSEHAAPTCSFCLPNVHFSLKKKMEQNWCCHRELNVSNLITLISSNCKFTCLCICHSQIHTNAYVQICTAFRAHTVSTTNRKHEQRKHAASGNSQYQIYDNQFVSFHITYGTICISQTILHCIAIQFALTLWLFSSSFD